MISATATAECTTSQRFAEFMQKQVRYIERFRRRLCRREKCEISYEAAVTLWIAQGYAAIFRRRFEQN